MRTREISGIVFKNSNHKNTKEGRKIHDTLRSLRPRLVGKIDIKDQEIEN
jgi:hypothetical protein